MRKATIILILLLYSALSQATVYHVGSDGDFTTIAQVNAQTFVGGDQVLFKKGESFYGSLTIQNSGSLNNRIVYGAYGTGANPIITGFTTVSAWTDLGSNIWESTSAVSTLSMVKVVSIGGVNVAMGKIPNSGYYTFQSHSGSTSITSSSLSGTPNWTGAEAVIRTNAFVLDRRSITSQSSGTINWTNALYYVPTDGYGFFIQNDIRTLDVQNEWYYNPSTKKISIYSAGQPTNVKVASIDYLTTVSAGYFTIENIQFIGANSTAIYSSSTTVRQHITIQNCNIDFSGVAAIRGIHSNNYIIENNTIDHGNTYGIGSPNNATLYNIIIRGNTVQNTALLSGMAQSMWSAIAVGKGTLVEYNRVINTGYHGITFYGDSITIKNNYVSTICTILQDGGGIYTYTGDVQAELNECKVYGNIVQNAVGNKDGTTNSKVLAAGIYFDEKSKNIECYNNTFEGCSWAGIYIGFNVNNVNIHHNTSYDNEIQISASDYESPGIRENLINFNRFIAKTATQKVIDHYSVSTRIPTFATSNNNYYARPIDDNLTMRYGQTGTGQSLRTLSQWKTFSSQDANSIGSPKTITDTLDLQFYYNDTKIAKVIVVPQRSIDVDGTAYSGNVTLQPFTSLVLIANTDYYVSTIGSNTNDGLTPLTAWATIPYACSQVTQPYSTINILNGTHTIATQCAVSVGVSIVGESKTGTIINSTLNTLNTPTIELESYPTATNGNQEISNFTFNGNFVGDWGVKVSYRSNVKIHDLVMNTFITNGIYFANGYDLQPNPYVTGNEVYNCTITNSAKKTVGGNQFGNISYGGQSGFKIYNNTITATGRTAGTNGLPIKFSGAGYNIYSEIYGNILVASVWVSGSWDFAIELWREQGGTVIHDNNIQGSIDLVRCYGLGTSTFNTKIYNNTLGRSSTQTQVEKGIYLEDNISDIYIYNNKIQNVACGLYIPRVANSYLRNVHVYYNIFSNLGQSGTDYQTWGIWYPDYNATTTGYEMHVYNNIFEAKQGLGKQIMYAIALPSIGNFTGFYAKNNICTGWQRGAFAQYATSSVVDKVEIKNNLFYNNGYNNDGNFQSGWLPTNYTYSGTIKTDPLLNSGYYPTSLSPTINAGLGVGLGKDYLWKFVNGIPDIGVIEYYPPYYGNPFGIGTKQWKF